MKNLRSAVAAALLFGLSLTASAQAPGTISPADEKAIDATLTSFGQSLTAMDFDTFGKLFTQNCDFINIVGMHWTGRAQVLAAHKVVFTTRYRGIPQRIIARTESPLAPGVVLVVSTIKMDDYTAQDGKRMTNNLFRMTWVLEKQDGHWLIRSAQNTAIDPEAAQHDPVNHP